MWSGLFESKELELAILEEELDWTQDVVRELTEQKKRADAETCKGGA